MPNSRTALASKAWRTPPKPATNKAPTPNIEIKLAQNIDDWLDRISSFSMIGKPVRPILVSGCRADICAIRSRSESVASVARAKSSFPLASRRMTKPSFPSLVSRYSPDSSLSVANDCGMAGQGD